MLAAVAAGANDSEPVKALAVQQVTIAEPPPGWATVSVKAAGFNYHDVWTLRGMATHRASDPAILGTDAAGTTADGRDVIVHAVIGPGRLLSEGCPGTLAEQVVVPEANLIPKPPELSFVDAACLPTAYLTAYNMLFGKGEMTPGEHVLIQGAGGGVATAAILLAVAGGLEVTVTSRDESRRQRALGLGAHHAVATGEKLPNRVDAVVETVGAATWSHSLKAVRPGGRIIVAGGTSGFNPSAELPMLFLRDVDVLGVFMGNARQLTCVARMMAISDLRPLVDRVYPLSSVHEAAQRMVDGASFGKLVILPTGDG